MFLMALSAAFARWLVGSMNCHLYSSFLGYAFNWVVAWLSVTLKVGLYPFSVSMVKIPSNAVMIVAYVMSLIGIANI